MSKKKKINSNDYDDDCRILFILLYLQKRTMVEKEKQLYQNFS